MAIALTNFLTLTPTRVVDDANNVRVDIAPIDCVPVLNEPSVTTNGQVNERSKRFSRTGDLYVRKGADLQDGDEITLPEGVFGIVGGPKFNQLHPMNSHDFGWVVYAIRKGG